jgi:hypothetical protein
MHKFPEVSAIFLGSCRQLKLKTRIGPQRDRVHGPFAAGLRDGLAGCQRDDGVSVESLTIKLTSALSFHAASRSGMPPSGDVRNDKASRTNGGGNRAML